MRASELAITLGLSKGRISQLVGDGALDGCYRGDGRDRVFDLEACAKALNRKLDPGQMLGNGAATKRRLREIERATAPGLDLPSARMREPETSPADGEELRRGDPDRYELARAAKAEQELRALLLKNGREEGQYVLASEVARDVSRAIGQEVREVETFLRDVSRALADRMGIDFKEARQTLLEGWRAHRSVRSEQLTAQAQASDLTPDEESGNI